MPYLKTLKNSRPFPDFEEYAIDMPYMILWSKIKKNTFSANTPYPKTLILRIGQYSVSNKSDMAYWSIRHIQKSDTAYPISCVKMDDPNITMEEYFRLEEEKAHRCAIVFNDTLTSEVALSCEPTVSSLNDEIDFRISFDESDDEDCTDLVKEISTNIGEEFTNLEILKCWILETSTRLFNTKSCS
ncbi:hypothetical protein Tco_0769339 [Tanacetum coccineum]|uniref:Uncharacterized protein n=1 Tax=Tanacetum coccineum TaxID=301880 RepID=A0ABQ4ZCP3_9ASTR